MAEPFSILGSVVPAGTSGVLPRIQLASAFLANDFWPGLVWSFANSGTNPIILAGAFRVPADYTAGAEFLIDWLSTPTSGNMQWHIDYRAVADAESLDPTTWQESVNTGAVAVPGTLGLRKQTTLAATAGNFAPGDIVLFQISRDPDVGGDTAAGDVHLFDLHFSYT